MKINSMENGPHIKVTSIRFDSLRELLDTTFENKGNEKVWADIKRYELSRSFINAPSPEAVIDKAINGDEETLRILEAHRSRLDRTKREPQHMLSAQKKRRRKRVRADQGDELDIHKVYAGQLDRAWEARKHIEVDKDQNLYTVFIDVGGLARVQFSTTLWRGAVAYQIVDDLIKAGKSVKVVVGAAAVGVIKGDMRRVVTTDIVVKHYNEPLSMTRLAAMSNIGFHRVFNFMSRCLQPKGVEPSMGSTHDYLRNNGPIEDVGVAQDVSKYIYVDRCCSLSDALHNLEKIYGGLK